MKCIVIETSPERTNARPVTDENGAAHIYATISEARAELKANGYSYNRANQRYYIKGTEYRAYIIREDSEEYDRAIEQAETIAETARPEDPEPVPIYQRAELEAFLGDCIDAYDVDAIEAEATEAGRWTPEAVRDLMSICERHERTA